MTVAMHFIPSGFGKEQSRADLAKPVIAALPSFTWEQIRATTEKLDSMALVLESA